MRTAPVSILLTLALLTASAAAQTVSVSGRPTVPFDPPSVACGMPVSALLVDDTDVYLTSSTLDLTPFVGVTIQAIGTKVPASCNLIDVSSVVAASYFLETCGGGSLGCPTRIKISSAGGGTFGLFLSLNNGFAPLSPTGGTFLLDPGTSLLVALAPEPANGQIQIDATIPVDPAFLVLSIKLQAIRAASGSSALEASTVDSIFTGTFTSPCFLPGC